MAPEVVEHVFEMFAQAKRTSDRAHGGLGATARSWPADTV
jgi:signal transduction histidine kinase